MTNFIQSFPLAILFFYCLIGVIVGLCQVIDGKWPVRHDNRKWIYNWICTVLFLILLGPFFWITGAFILFFRLACKLLK
jgi:hypothetical protein